MANEATEWLASVSEHCRKLIEIAGLAIRDRNEYEQDANKGTLRAALNAHKEALQGLLPEDFPNSRIGVLARHIGFCEPNDWYDIVLFDVPDILAKAERYASEMPDGQLGGFDEFLHARFRPRLELALREAEPDFHALILTYCVDLATHFQRKAGAADDSDGEIGRIFSPNNPQLLVAGNLETDTDRNLQRGAMLLMQGWRSFLRNPHAHEVRPTDEENAVHALMLMSLLARIIDGATRVEEEAAA
ncbi:TIGR02391 family protein [Altererythrobacter confluentis]|uniref:TIGR02391 family protein n=1 Tax=Allopontixanthobacter confluentis TaxID=1849021 RepID=A0A6L7GEV7_9SPHN|nr:TIGR02391 family protein [Allopontixanthobacter confluentis]MXP14025.1 TIGR02391 family protein [Allopontixanthobacter confluentis]